MGTRKSGWTSEQIIKDVGLAWRLRQYVQEHHPKTKIHFLLPPKGEAVNIYNYAIRVLTEAGVIVQDPKAPKKLRDYAERVIKRAYDAVCLDLGGQPRKGISLDELDFDSYRRLIQEISKTFKACRKIWRTGKPVGIKEKEPLITWIRKEVDRGMPAAPNWESAVKISVNTPWKGKREITVILDILAALTGRERASVGGEKKKFDQYLEGLDRKLARTLRALKRNK